MAGMRYQPHRSAQYQDRSRRIQGQATGHATPQPTSPPGQGAHAFRAIPGGRQLGRRLDQKGRDSDEDTSYMPEGAGASGRASRPRIGRESLAPSRTLALVRTLFSRGVTHAGGVRSAEREQPRGIYELDRQGDGSAAYRSIGANSRDPLTEVRPPCEASGAGGGASTGWLWRNSREH